MKFNAFVNEILTQELHTTSNGLIGIPQAIFNYIENPSSVSAEAPQLEIMAAAADGTRSRFNGEKKEGIVAIIPIRGLMHRYNSWYSYGMEQVASWLTELYANDHVKGIILDFDTNGGTRAAMQVLENAIIKKNKPVYSFVNMFAYSAGYYVSCYCDKIYASHRNAGIGNIGIISIIQDDSKAWEKYGIKRIIVKPPESEFKNKEVEDAIQGKTKALIEEHLSPLAQDFQEMVKSKRKKLNLEVEGVIKGKNFFAKDSTTTNGGNGLIDGIKTIEDVVQELLGSSAKNDQLRQNLSNLLK